MINRRLLLTVVFTTSIAAPTFAQAPRDSVALPLTRAANDSSAAVIRSNPFPIWSRVPQGAARNLFALPVISLVDPAPQDTTRSYVPPRGSERLQRYAWDAAGPVAIFRAGFAAGFSQASGRPSEWGSGADAFGRRFASHYGELLIQETVRHGLASAVREDTRYERCTCGGVLPRVGHALLSTVTARSQGGRRRLSVASTIAPFAGSMTAVALWYPERFGARDGLRGGGLAFAGYAGTNILREFLPIK